MRLRAKQRLEGKGKKPGREDEGGLRNFKGVDLNNARIYGRQIPYAVPDR